MRVAFATRVRQMAELRDRWELRQRWMAVDRAKLEPGTVRNRLAGIFPETAIEYRLAATQDERMAAFRLVYDQYLEAGLIVPNNWRMHVSAYCALPTTSVVIGLLDQNVVSTVTLVVDSDWGLPLEDIYGLEVMKRRQAGLQLSEISCLAMTRVPGRSSLEILIGMTRVMAQHARLRGMDQMLLAAHPKHARFYERYMGFQRFGGLRAYPKVQNRPAVAACLDFETIDRHRPKCWDQYFADRIPARQLTAPPTSRIERDVYRQLAVLTGNCESVCDRCGPGKGTVCGGAAIDCQRFTVDL